MQRVVLVLSLGLSLAVAACGGGDTAQPVTSTARPVETTAATTDSATTTDSGLGAPTLETVAEGLERPTGVAALPNGDLLVLEQHEGRVRTVRGGTVVDQPALDLSERISTDSEQGLLGIALDVDASGTGRMYLNLTDRDGVTRILGYDLFDGTVDPASEEELLSVTQPRSNHNGGHLAIGPDGYLWIGLGDGGGSGDPDDRAQNPDDLLGKMLRIDPSDPTADPKVWASGLRNPWRYAFDDESGTLWIGDVGQNSYEEISRIDAAAAPGANFGWRLFEGTAEYDNPTGATPANYVAPIAQYGHDDGCSVTGGLVVRDRSLPLLDGRYLFGDYCSGRLWTIPVDAAAGVVPTEVTDLLGAPVEGLVSFGTDADGRVVLVTADGRLVRIVPA
jgi:glucose/arabinose dehydrogenase